MDGDSSVAYAPFYIEVAEIAKLKGVTVSIVSLEGEDCSMDNLSVVTEQTSGEVERVDPRYLFFLILAPFLHPIRSLAKNFQSILTNPIIATGCMATIFLHKGLMFKNEVDDELEVCIGLISTVLLTYLQADENLLRKDLGNVTADTECTFSYAFRPKSQIDLTGINEVPFQVILFFLYLQKPLINPNLQVQLVYTKLNGMQLVRVATASIQLTEDRTVAEKQANMEVIGTHAAQKAAKFGKNTNNSSSALLTLCFS